MAAIATTVRSTGNKTQDWAAVHHEENEDAIILVRACASLYQFWTHVYKKILSIFEQKLGLDLFKSIELITVTFCYHF